jgi:hypothetical protein
MTNTSMKNKTPLTALQVERAIDKRVQKNYPESAAAQLGYTQGFLESILTRLSQKDLQELVRIHNLSV